MYNQSKLNISVRKFSGLSVPELYEILQLRSEVFVVEQNCVYQDIDGKDENALHILGYNNNTLVAYARCFPPGFYFEEAAIGRVAVKEVERENAFGHVILRAAIRTIQENYHTGTIKLSAQQYLTKFYESHGFEQIGKGYLEDGILHVAMIRKAP